ncbi:MAG TPA: helix-turn-helix domain-containing protein [Niabella sp.]|nr:helix-turn-helix domain-containing protein [Niabella sp.]HRB87092.1 helix-turn-helix domain-containing protein [Bacteroidia bacterium]HQX21585.1 helix-turn-helix domain-containing protein [Niabella sp.]HQX42776.1 helix-turn-helix domain-containing protein [Niabella sp.]HRB37205.1 helix-turn-helix domain-containing protein [Niabella sp.]
MYKNVPSDLKKINLNSDLYKLHKSGKGTSDFGMDKTSELLGESFGLYSTLDLKKNIGPIKTQYYRISLTRKGSAIFDIGLEKYNTKRNSILFGIPGQIFSLHQYSNDFLAYYMLFTEKFINDVLLKQNRKQHFPFLSYTGLQCFQLDDSTADEVENIIFKINSEVKEHKVDCSEMIALYLHQIILLANRHYGTVLLSNQNSPNSHQALYSDFIKTVSQYYLTVRKVAAYADMLHISPDHLNRAIKSCSNKTAHELIDEMLMMEAKAYLLHTPQTISEITYKLEFSDPSHFNRFFKKYCGLTPLEFRNQS